MPAKKNSFEENMEKLEKIVSQLENGEAPLDECISLFESGVKIADDCAKMLEVAKQKVKILTENGEKDFELKEE